MKKVLKYQQVEQDKTRRKLLSHLPKLSSYVKVIYIYIYIHKYIHICICIYINIYKHEKSNRTSLDLLDKKIE